MMQRILTIFVCGLCGHALLAGEPAGNLVPNGTFEDGTGGWLNTWAVTGSHVTERAHSGTGSARLAHPENENSIWLLMLQDVPVGPLYQIETYVYRDRETIQARIGAHTNSPPYSRSSASEKVQKTGGWERLVTTIAARPNGEVWIHLHAEGQGTVWFDDVSLTIAKPVETRRAELTAVIESKTATAASKAQAYLDLGELTRSVDQDLKLAVAYYEKVPLHAPDNKTQCRLAWDAVAEASRSGKDYAAVTAAIRKKVARHSSADALEGAQDMARLAEALGEEAFHLQPDYAAALKRLEEALQLYEQATALCRQLDAQMHKGLMDILADRIVVTRYDINEYSQLQ